MKVIVNVILVVVLCFTIGMKAQNNDVKIYKVWVTFIDDSKLVKGVLYDADESKVTILKNNSIEKSGLLNIKPERIHKLKLRRVGSVGRGVWVGALIGVGVGGVVGFAGGDDKGTILSYTAEEKAVGLGIVLGVLGSGISPLIASKKKKILINGNLDVYKQHLEEIQKYSLEFYKKNTN